MSKKMAIMILIGIAVIIGQFVALVFLRGCS